MVQPQSHAVQETFAVEEFTDFFDAAGPRPEAQSRTSGTDAEQGPGRIGHDTIEAAEVSTYISTAEAAKLARVDSRTIRRWHEQNKVRGRFTKGRLLILKEDLLSVADSSDDCSAGASGTEPGTSTGTSGTENFDDPGHPGPSADKQTPALAFIDLVGRIERLSRENGELRAMLEEQRRENQSLRLLTQNRSNWLDTVRSWFSR